MIHFTVMDYIVHGSKNQTDSNFKCYCLTVFQANDRAREIEEEAVAKIGQFHSFFDDLLIMYFICAEVVLLQI